MEKTLWIKDSPCIRLEGEGCYSFLQGQTTADISKAREAEIINCCWLDASARVKALFEIQLYDQAADVNIFEGSPELVMDGFSKVIFPADKISVKPLFYKTRIQEISFQHICTKQVRFIDENSKLYVPQSTENIVDKEFLDQWRFSEGIPFFPGELNGSTNPFELGLANWVSLNKGCYLGQESIAKILRAGVLKQELRFWESDEDIKSGDILFKQNIGSSSPLRAGYVTTSAKKPSQGKTAGLALIRRDFVSDPQLVAGKDLSVVRLFRPRGFLSPFDS